MGDLKIGWVEDGKEGDWKGLGVGDWKVLGVGDWKVLGVEDGKNLCAGDWKVCGVGDWKVFGVGEGNRCLMPGAGLAGNLGLPWGSLVPCWMAEPGPNWSVGRGLEGRGAGGRREGKDCGTAGVGRGMKGVLGLILGTAGVEKKGWGLVKLVWGTAGVGWGMKGRGLENRC